MKKSLIPLLISALPLAGCAYNPYYYQTHQQQQYHQPQIVRQPVVEQRKPSHEDMVKWYQARYLKSPYRNLEGAVSVSSEFFATVIDEASYKPPKMNLDDWYPTYEFYPGDKLGVLCFHKNNETKAAHLMFYSPSGELIDGKGFEITSPEDQIVGKIYDVSDLINKYGEGVYQGKWFFYAHHVKTSLADLKK